MPTRPPTHRPPGMPSREEAERRRQAFYNQHQRAPASSVYDAEWRKLSVIFRRRHPVCSTPGCGRPTQEADHIISPKDRPDLRLAWSNLRAFCKPCHSRRTAVDQGFARPGDRT